MIPPRVYGKSTIYTDAVRKQWRIKVEVGSRFDVKVAMSNAPKAQWEKVVKRVMEENP